MPMKTFQISDEQENRIKKLPRSFNFSEEMRVCLDKVLAKYEQPFLRKALTETQLSKTEKATEKGIVMVHKATLKGSGFKMASAQPE